ncbi:MAG: TetR/AcrR family transcriptional regulator [Anaerolineales bacterium]|nr:TetR/AcrR family transcriptional regulator [Anaerolineales bacterium]MCS7247545.1 TetR/AcrR family transcriptional regulator [Anaerolineales bacterium]MDW8161356.1 TetR/AcrR family transcriptional regulator [Anaerolineales bacterium]MDW8447087.1 TetR/AcrR family transcriptional regulator [Anaerolineales bacterium]
MTRDAILEAAAQIFRQKGYHAASMQDIADAVKLQKASLYHHVNSKQEILLALLDRALDLLIERMEEVLALDLPPEEKLRRAILVYLQTMLEQRDLSAVLLLEYRSLDPKCRQQHIQRRDQYEALWRKLLSEGAEQGIFAVSDIPLICRFLLGVMNWTVTWYREDGPLTPAQLAHQCANLFLLGLKKRLGEDDRGDRDN